MAKHGDFKKLPTEDSSQEDSDKVNIQLSSTYLYLLTQHMYTCVHMYLLLTDGWPTGQAS